MDGITYCSDCGATIEYRGGQGVLTQTRCPDCAPELYLISEDRIMHEFTGATIVQVIGPAEFDKLLDVFQGI